MKIHELITEIQAWHSSPRPRIEKFRPLSHFGNLEAAKDRAQMTADLYQKNFANLYQLDLDIKNPGRVRDYDDLEDPSPSSYDMMKLAMWSQDLMQDPKVKSYVGPHPEMKTPTSGDEILSWWYSKSRSGQWDSFPRMTPGKWIQSWINTLKQMGIDGLVYKNQVESPGSDSYIIFSSDQVKFHGRSTKLNLQNL